MNPSFQSSFIPKDPITDEVFKKKKTGLLGILAITLFIVSILASGGVFAYKMFLQNEIDNLKNQSKDIEKTVDRETISEMSEFSAKLSLAKSLISKHQIVTNFLSVLSSSTVSTVQFIELNYGSATSKGLAVSMKGKTNSYSSIALQESVFSNIDYFKNVSFSNLNLSDKGEVFFEVSILIDPKILTYE